MRRFKICKTSMVNTQTLTITNSDLFTASVLIGSYVEIEQVICKVACGTSIGIPLMIRSLLCRCHENTKLGCVTLVHMIKSVSTRGS